MQTALLIDSAIESYFNWLAFKLNARPNFRNSPKLANTLFRHRNVRVDALSTKRLFVIN